MHMQMSSSQRETEQRFSHVKKSFIQSQAVNNEFSLCLSMYIIDRKHNGKCFVQFLFNLI